jgi:hypothetical protein
MKLAVKVIFCLIISAIIGVGSALAVVKFRTTQLGTTNGPWQYNILTGNKDADIYTRAAIARVGLFALEKSESIYFLALRDSAGDRLEDTCRYRISGSPLTSRWWSVTLYAEDNYLLPNDANVHSVTSTSLELDPDDKFTVNIGPQPTDGNWLPNENAGKFNLILRLYNPDASIYNAMETVALPDIEKKGCK